MSQQAGTAVYYGNVFKTNWRDFKAVCAVAEHLGHGQSVVKHRDRNNFNITHTSRRDLIERRGVTELYCTI